MSFRASTIGELAEAQMQSSSEGRATRVFRRSVYVETGEGLVLLLQGELKSPMTVNVESEASLEGLISAEERCAIDRETIRFARATVVKRGAKLYRSELFAPAKVNVLAKEELRKGAVAMQLLYQVSAQSVDLVGSMAFSGFIESIVRPLGKRDERAVHRVENYLPLIGMGGGFTPSGDDFVAGFVSTYNFVARSNGSEEINLPFGSVAERTVPESARMLEYAQRGHVDEELSGLILSAVTTNHRMFWESLLRVAGRGHTSGIDMSLGVILASATLAEARGEPGATENVVQVLGGFERFNE
ncbi:MAG: DUF2877 domain-containing protein [Nitrososphaerota archaeon]|nr:DUF2877 domain-containing protein [Nitrososphaerota archaeon]